MKKRDTQLNIRVTVEERKEILNKAEEYGLEPSAYLRLILKLGRLPKPKN